VYIMSLFSFFTLSSVASAVLYILSPTFSVSLTALTSSSRVISPCHRDRPISG